MARRLIVIVADGTPRALEALEEKIENAVIDVTSTGKIEALETNVYDGHEAKRKIAGLVNADKVPALFKVAREATDLSETLSDEFEDAADWKDAKSALQAMGRRVAAALAAMEATQ